MASKKKRKIHRSFYAAILYFDMDRFGNDRLVDMDRTILRDDLQKLIKDAFVYTELESDSRYTGDTGDGVLLVINPKFDKSKLITEFIPRLEYNLNDRNRCAADFLQLKIRAVIHCGEILEDEPEITGKGVVSNEIIIAARLLDSEFLKTMVRDSNRRSPIALLVSDDFYNKILCQQTPVIAKNFSKFDIPTKDRSIPAWAYNFDSSSQSHQQSGSNNNPENTSVSSVSQDVKSSDTKVSVSDGKASADTKKSSMTLGELGGRVLFLAGADIYNFELYRRLAGIVPLKSHLETALLLGRTVVLHCADPFRRVEVYNLLKEYNDFIRNGDILFLFGTAIQDVQKDYENYLRMKADQYLKSGYGKKDLESMRPGLDKPNILGRVKELLDTPPVLLKRGYGGTSRFVDLVQKDLEQKEKIATYDYLVGSKIKKLNLTLYQLLHLRKIKEDGTVDHVFGSTHTVDKVIARIQNRISHRKFSRQIMMEMIRDSFDGEGIELYYNFIESRVNLLHLQINVDRYNFIEFVPERDQSSPYYYKLLQRHLAILADVAPKDSCGPALVNELRNLPSWPRFVSYHLSIMADAYARRLADQPLEPEMYFSEAKSIAEFESIGQSIRKVWG
jgi:hypothetical protein